MSDNGFLTYIFKRLLWTIPVLLGASFVAFILIHLAPSNPAELMLGQRATPERIAMVKEQYGLDRPLYVQYFDFVAGAVQGDLGRSIRTEKPVLEMILSRLPYTLQLASMSLLVAMVIGLGAGIISALRTGSTIDHTSRLFALFGISMPNFWLGMLLILFIAVPISMFPIYGITLVTEDFVTGIISTTLSAIALGTALSALIMRMIRGSLLDELNKDYVLTARAYGLPSNQIAYVYVLKNALLPTLTVIGLQIGYLIGGSVVIETVFGISGIGRMMLTAILQQDFPVIQGVILLVAVGFVLANFGIDIIYALLDPRIRYGGEDS